MSLMARGAVALLVALVLTSLVASVALAQDELLGGKLRTGDTVTIGPDESVDGDLYLLGGTITVDGTIDGDLTALGGQLLLSGTVTGDVLAAGGSVSIAGTVDGDVRASGGQVNLNGTVGEDVVAAAGQTTVQGNGTVEGDLVVSGGQVTVAGAVAGNIEANAGTYSRSGTVGGTEHVTQQEREDDVRDEAGEDVFDAVRHFAVLAILGALMLWVVPWLLRDAGGALRQRPLASLVWGMVTMVGYVVLVIVAILVIVLLAILFGLLQLGALAAIEVVGGLLALGVVSFVFVVAVAFLADLVVSWALARLVARDPGLSWWQQLGLLLIGVAVVVVVTSLPIIGGIAKLAVVIFGLGALVLALRGFWSERQMRTTPAPPTL
jgi:cytoskeletal protein CcmA (bactofilin family)